MNEREFLLKLQARALQQEKIVNDMVFPRLFKTVSFWLGNHPWRIFVPLAFLLTLIAHYTLGKSYDDLILRIFGGPK